MQQSSATPKTQDVGIGLRKIVACSQSSSQCLLVSTVFGTVSSLHPTSVLMIFILVSLIFLSVRARRALQSGLSLDKKISETSIKIIKTEVGCKDDTVPKTVDTRRHCEED